MSRFFHRKQSGSNWNLDTPELVYASVEVGEQSGSDQSEAQRSVKEVSKAGKQSAKVAVQGPPRDSGDVSRRYCNEQPGPSTTQQAAHWQHLTLLSSTSLPPQTQVLTESQKWLWLPAQNSQGKANLSGKQTAKQKSVSPSSQQPCLCLIFLKCSNTCSRSWDPTQKSHPGQQLLLRFPFDQVGMVHSGSRTRVSDKEAFWRPTAWPSTLSFQPGISALLPLFFLIHMDKKRWCDQK